MKDEIEAAAPLHISSFSLHTSYFILSQRVHGGLLGGEEDDVVEVSGCGQLGGADGLALLREGAAK